MNAPDVPATSSAVCLPLAYADLVDVDSLRELDAAWRRLERHAAEHGCTVHLVAGRGN